MDALRHLLEALMGMRTVRMLERLGGAALLLLGFAWLILGLRSLAGENFVLRGAVVVIIIAAVLMLSGALLAKPKQSNAGRVLAILVCLLGAFREAMLFDHQSAETLSTGGWIGFALVALYVLIVIVVIASFVFSRRPAVQ